MTTHLDAAPDIEAFGICDPRQKAQRVRQIYKHLCDGGYNRVSQQIVKIGLAALMPRNYWTRRDVPKRRITKATVKAASPCYMPSLILN